MPMAPDITVSAVRSIPTADSAMMIAIAGRTRLSRRISSAWIDGVSDWVCVMRRSR